MAPRGLRTQFCGWRPFCYEKKGGNVFTEWTNRRRHGDCMAGRIRMNPSTEKQTLAWETRKHGGLAIYCTRPETPMGEPRVMGRDSSNAVVVCRSSYKARQKGKSAPFRRGWQKGTISDVAKHKGTMSPERNWTWRVRGEESSKKIWIVRKPTLTNARLQNLLQYLSFLMFRSRINLFFKLK